MYLCDSAVSAEAVCVNTSASVDNVDDTDVVTSFLHEDDQVSRRFDSIAIVFIPVHLVWYKIAKRG